jgi:hypothetical protein
MGNNDEPYKQRKTRNNKLNFGNVFQPSRVRRTIQSRNDIDRFLLDYGYNFLPYITIVSWVIFFLTRY